MSSTPAAAKPRPADVVNDEIRSLWQQASGGLSPTQRHEYEVLVTEWAAAVRGEIVEAA